MIPITQIFRRYVSFCSELNDERYVFSDNNFNEISFLESVDKKSDLQSRTYYFIFEILRFNRLSKKANESSQDNQGSLGEFLDKYGFSD